MQLDEASYTVITLDKPDANAPLAAIVLLDEDALDRIESLTRFWTQLRFLRFQPDPRLTRQRRRRLSQVLRVFDARLEHRTYRDIANVIFRSHEIDASSWAGNPLRETVIRLARDGATLVNGGYRTLLRRSRRR